MARLEVIGLPDEPLAAAAQFYAEWLVQAVAILSSVPGEGLLTLIFPPADHTHRGWRLAAVQSLAREHAPARVNAVAGAAQSAIAAALAYLEAAEGVTGQYLPLDDAGAGPVL